MDHWIALTPIDQPDTVYGMWTYIPRNVSNHDGSLTAPGVPGQFELRLYLNWPEGDHVVVKRQTVNITE
jgi:hypothetical protein